MTRVTAAPGLEEADLDGLPWCPYRGLRPYTERDGDYFFGRDRDRDLVIANLMASRITVLYGASGVGKSSLLRAGVLRQLRRLSDGAFSYLAVGRAVAVYYAAWRDDPLAGLAAALREAIPHDAIPGELAPDDLVPPHVSLSVDLLRQVTERLNADVYLLCDQFEEIALNQQKGTVGEAFAAELGRIVGAPALRVNILLGIREDALAKLDRLEARAPGPFTNRLRLDHLDEAAARQAIEQPLQRYNAGVPPDETVDIEPGLVDELLRELLTGRVTVGDVPRGGAEGTPEGIETPFLQLVMIRLWSQEQAQGSRLLRRSTLEELGGAERIVRTHLDAVMDQLTEQQQEVAAHVFRCLVTRSGMKMAYTVDDLVDGTGITDRELLNEVLGRLAAGQGRVLRSVPPRLQESGPPRYEIFHDVMTEAVLDWRRTYEAERTRRASVRALEEALLRRRVLARRVGLVGLAVIALLIGAMSIQQRSLRSQRRLALSRQLTTVASALVQKQPDTAALLSLESLSLGRGEEQQPPAVLIDALTRLEHSSRRFSTSGDIRGLAVSPKADVLATALGDGSVQLWNLISGRHEGAPFTTRSGPATAVAFSPDGHLLATADLGSVWVWNVPGHQLRARLPQEGRGVVYDVAFGADGTLLATAQQDGSVQLWDVRDGKPRRRPLQGRSQGAVYDVAFSRDGTLLASAGKNGVVRLHDVASGRLHGRPLSSHTGAVNGVAFSPDGRLLAAAGTDGVVRLWDVASGRPRAGSLPGHVGAATAVAFSPDGTLLASAGKDTTVRLWDVASGTAHGQPLTGHTSAVIGLAFSADGRHLVSADANRTVRVWTVAEATLGKPLSGHRDNVNEVAFSPDGRWLASASDDRTVRLWDVASGRPHGQPLTGHTGPVTGVAFNRDGTLLASASADGTARLWDVASRRPLGRPLGAGTAAMTAVTFSPDGTVLATAAQDGAVRLWDVSSGKPRGGPLEDQTGGVYDVAFSPDGRLLAAASEDPDVRLWDVARGRLQRRLSGHTGAVVAVAFRPDGTLLASGSTDGSVRLWEPVSGKPRGTPLTGHSGRVSGVAFRADGTVLASAAGDGIGVVRLWNVPQGTPRGRPLISRNGVVWNVAFSPDSQRLALARWDNDTTIRLWNVNAASWVRDGCTLVGRNLSQQEWNQYVGAFAGDADSEQSGWSRFVGRFVGDPTYERTCGRFDAGDGAPADAPAARYSS